MEQLCEVGNNKQPRKVGSRLTGSRDNNAGLILLRSVIDVNVKISVSRVQRGNSAHSPREGARICDLGRRGDIPRDFKAGAIAQGQSHSAVGTSRWAALFGSNTLVSDTAY
jgi:hypothetical protein